MCWVAVLIGRSRRNAEEHKIRMDSSTHIWQGATCRVRFASEGDGRTIVEPPDCGDSASDDRGDGNSSMKSDRFFDHPLASAAAAMNATAPKIPIATLRAAVDEVVAGAALGLAATDSVGAIVGATELV